MQESQSHIERLIREKVYAVCLVQGATTEGRDAFAYVAVPMSEMESFALAQQQYGFVPSEHGQVLISGFGVPTEEVQQKMTNEYGFNHEDAIIFSNQV